MVQDFAHQPYDHKPTIAKQKLKVAHIPDPFSVCKLTICADPLLQCKRRRAKNVVFLLSRQSFVSLRDYPRDGCLVTKHGQEHFSFLLKAFLGNILAARDRLCAYSEVF